MKKICFTVPVDHCEKVKAAMYEAGAGRFNNYDMQCWKTLGHGEWRPLPGSNPTIGKTGILERVEEYKVEMFCEDELVDAAIVALLTAHPYEGPQFEVYSIENDLQIERD